MHEDTFWHLPICRSHLEALSWPLFALNETEAENSTDAPLSDASTLLKDETPPHAQTEWFQVVLPIICTIGISGNILNLIVLTRKRFCAPMGKLERSANLGLTALALSDMLLCTAVFPHAFIPQGTDGLTPVKELFILYYKVYGISLINLFLMTSTWLIVALAIERYIVLYYPLRAKWILSLKRTKVLLICVYVISVLLTLPYFVNVRITQCIGLDGLRRHEITPRWLDGSHSAVIVRIYNLHIWPVIAVFFPLLVLFVCNIRLIQGLRNVPTTRRLKCPGQTVRDVNTRITLTLIIIVATALILVTPSEILKVINPFKRWGIWGGFIAKVANLMQSLNFAFNFVLYCAIDRNFRHICRNVILGHCRSRTPIPADTEVIFFYRPKTGSFSVRGQKCTLSGHRSKSSQSSNSYSGSRAERAERMFL